MTSLRSFRARRLGAALAAPLLAAALGALTPSGAAAQSFNCGTNTAPDEQAICGNHSLAQLDVKMATLYDVATHLSAMGARGDLQDQQRAWLARRQLCGADVGCIRTAYTTRIDALEAYLKGIYGRGPY